MSANCMKAKMLSAALFVALVLSAMQSVRALDPGVVLDRLAVR